MKNKNLLYIFGTLGVVVIVIVAVMAGSSKQFQGYLGGLYAPTRINAPSPSVTFAPAVPTAGSTVPVPSQPSPPILSLNPVIASGTLTSNSQFPLMAVNIATGGAGLFELSASNQNTVTFNMTSTGNALPTGNAGDYCGLYAVGGFKMASANTVANGPITFTLGVAGTNDNSGVAPINSKLPGGYMNIQCATLTGPGATISVSLTGITYGNGSAKNIPYTGKELPLIGPTFTSGL